MLLLLVLASPLILFLLHVLLSRIVLVSGVAIPTLIVLLLAMVIGFVITFALGWQWCLKNVIQPVEILCGLLYATTVYGCFAQAYFHLFMMGETARRLHILYELKLYGPQTKIQLMERYGAQTMLSVRLERLVASRQLAVRGNRYVLQNQFLYRISNILMHWGKLLGFRAEFLE